MPTTSLSQLLPHRQCSFNHAWNHPFYSQQQTRRDHSQLLHLNNNNYHPSHLHHPSNNYACGNVMMGNPCSGPIIYLRSTAATARPHPLGLGIGTMQLPQKGGGSVGLNPRGTEDEESVVFESVPLVQGKAAAKRLRLFGVNMECPISEQSSEDQEDDNFDIPSTAIPHPTIPSQFPRFCSSPPPPSSSRSSTSPLQLGPHHCASRPPLHTMHPHGSSDSDSKGKPSTSLDFGIYLDHGVPPGAQE